MSEGRETEQSRLQLETLRSRAEFLAVRGGARWAGEAFVLEARRRKARQQTEAHVPSGPRFGFTVTKKIGNAVVRNRIRRRLKAAVSSMPGNAGVAFCDYVLIARLPALKRPFQDLKADLEKALGRVRLRLETPDGAPSHAGRSPTPR